MKIREITFEMWSMQCLKTETNINKGITKRNPVLGKSITKKCSIYLD
jgi:phage pi2 protein 07